MTTAVTTADGILRVRARPAGFVADLASVAGRALRQIPRDPEAVIPAILVPAIFYIMNIGALSSVTHTATGILFKAFALPASVIFAVTGVSRASALVLDIKSGYFDRLTITPVRRLPLLLGLMMADLALVMALAVPVILLGLALGVRFATGLPGMVLFVVISGCWGLVFTGLPYAIALKTGNPAAVNSSFILFFPFVFLTTTFAPLPVLAGWMQAIAHLNPMTYVLAGLRSLIGAQAVPHQAGAWHWRALGGAVLAIVGFGVVSMTLAVLALRGRVRRR
ncbi:MAG TPA: ABC transporter permease [Acidimicrobiales bacterium]|nr:ABC transporter permease [Acidimicrobiales bacterium]